MFWLWLGLFILALLFGFVILFGAPYLPTLRSQIDAAIELLELKPGQTLLELGSGDGRVLKAAAEKNLKAIGYELNPLLVIVSKLKTRRYRHKVTVKWGDFWSAEWPITDGIFVFLLPKYMAQLDKKIVQSKQGKVKLVSFAFQIPGKKPVKEKSGVYLYEY